MVQCACAKINIPEEPTMFENLIEILKANPRKIVYTEGSDARILESAARLKKDGFLTPILVGNVDEIKAAAATPKRST